MSDDRPDFKPKIHRYGLDRIGRELRGVYGKILQEPLPDNVRRAVHSLEDANLGLSDLKFAAQALRNADQPRPKSLQQSDEREDTSNEGLRPALRR